MRALRRMRLIHSERGAALVEVSLFFSALVLILMGIADYALVIQQAMEIQEAAAAGAAYGAIQGNASNTAGMQTAATNAASGVSGFTAVATNVYTCTPGGATVASTYSCPSYGAPIEYVKIQTSATVPTLLSYVGIPQNFAVSATALYRVR